MTEMLDSQACPYCQHEVEDHQSVWTYEAEEEVECNNCNKTYISKPQYTFKGWLIEKQCDNCKTFTDDGQWMCSCHDDDDDDDDAEDE